jgi:hypothetical protein
MRMLRAVIGFFCLASGGCSNLCEKEFKGDSCVAVALELESGVPSTVNRVVGTFDKGAAPPSIHDQSIGQVLPFQIAVRWPDQAATVRFSLYFDGSLVGTTSQQTIDPAAKRGEIVHFPVLTAQADADMSGSDSDLSGSSTDLRMPDLSGTAPDLRM